MLSELFTQAVILSLSAALIALLVIFLRLILKKAPRGLVCALWALVAVRLLIPTLPESKVSVVPQQVSEGAVVREISERPVENTVKVREYEPEYEQIVARQPQLPVQRETVRVDQNADPALKWQSAVPVSVDTVQNTDKKAAEEIVEVKYVEVSARTLEAPKTFGNTVLPVLSVVWLAGIGLMLLYMAFSYFRVWQKVQASVRDAGNVWLCDGISSPFILGVIRPRIYLPSSLADGDKAYVLAHEQAHLKRLDHIWKPLGFLLLSVYWFNPVTWIAYILLCRDIEMACDEKVIGHEGEGYKKEYSEALLACSAKQRMVTACPLAFGEVGVKTRIKSVLNYRKPAFWILAGALVISLVAAGCALTNPKETKGSEVPESTAAESTAAESEAPESTPAESAADVTKEETTPMATKEAETTAEDPAEVPLKAQQTFADIHFRNNYWDFHIWEKTPSVLPKSADVLPDTLSMARGKTDDVRNGSSYYIAALDLTVEIPEGYYLYRVDGLFRDADGNPVRMEFVDEYILALRDLSEEELVREIYAYQEDYAEYPCPHWVLWNFKVFHKDYLPVEQLYDSQIDMTEELRQAGDYLVSTGTTRGWFKDNIWEGYYADFNSPEINKLMEEAFGSDAFDWEALYQQHEKEYDWPIRIAADQWYTDDFINQVLAASEGSGISYYYLQPDYINGDYTSHQLLLFYNDGRMTWCWERFADASILNDAWWTDFMFAMQELKTNPEKYAYPEIEVLFADGREEEGYYAPLPETETSEEWKARKAEQAWQREGWVQDYSADITARAFVYAWLKAMGQETPLEDIVIYLKQSKNDARFFLAFTMDRGEGCELTPAYKGVDYLSLGDLEFARNYVEQYVK